MGAMASPILLDHRSRPMAAVGKNSPEKANLFRPAALLLRDARAPLNRAQASSRNLGWVPRRKTARQRILVNSRALSDSAMHREH
jgi:hypothetical protein